MEDRKKDHIEMAFQSQNLQSTHDVRFFYEPMLSAHPLEGILETEFLGKQMKVPMWISSMTGGTKMAAVVNGNLARACHEFGMGMGLGSCRTLLENDIHFPDFDLRDTIGDELPFYANLGICQVEQLLGLKQIDKIHNLIEKLRADGLILHVNPMQEWLQPEGDKLLAPPLDTIKRLLDLLKCPLIVKEVGQGIGPESLKELLKLPLTAIEFAAYGGTNFAKLEMLRQESDQEFYLEPLTYVGADALEMLETVNEFVHNNSAFQCSQLIISGGVHSFLDGYYLINKSILPAVFGGASIFLKHATGDYDALRNFISQQIKGLQMATAYLRIRQ